MGSATDRQRLSQLRRRLLDLRDEAGRLLQLGLAHEPLVKGSVYRMRRKCGRLSCRCARGQLHATMVLSWSQGGRTHLRVIPPDQVARLRTLTRRYQRFRRARARLVRVQRQILRLIDQLEAARRQGR